MFVVLGQLKKKKKDAGHDRNVILVKDPTYTLGSQKNEVFREGAEHQKLIKIIKSGCSGYFMRILKSENHTITEKLKGKGN